MEERRVLNEQAIVCGNGLDRHHRQIVRMRLHGRFEGVEVVEGQDQRLAGVRFGDARGRGCAEGRQATARLDQQGIHVTVIAPFELQDLGLSGHPAGQSDRAHGRLRSTGDEPNALGVRVVIEDHAPQLIFESGGGPKRRSIRDGLENAVLNHRVGVPQDEGPPRAAEIDVPLAIRIPDVGPFTPVNEERGSPHRPKGADRRIHPTGKPGLGFGKQSGTVGAGVGGMGHGWN